MIHLGRNGIVFETYLWDENMFLNYIVLYVEELVLPIKFRNAKFVANRSDARYRRGQNAQFTMTCKGKPNSKNNFQVN